MSQALTRQQPAAVPAFLKREGEKRGADNIQNSDIKPPALRLAQAMSPEVKRSEPEYIDGLREGDLFNSITQQIYGDTPVHFLVINYLGHRNVQFDPNDRKVVIDGDVPDNDPRCSFTTKVVDGKVVKQKPVATTFKDFLILLLPEGQDPQVMTLTLKSTQLKKATRLLSTLQFSKLDTFAHLVRATPVPERKGGNSWYGWRLDVVGYPTEEQFLEAERQFKSFEGKNVALDTEAEATAADVGGAQSDEDIPF